jgi:Zn-dependent protease with chaperone function
MSNDDEGTHASTADALIWPQIDRTPTSVLYAVGLAVVTVAMVLLPIIYSALIACAAYAVYWHLMNDTWILDTDGVALIRALAYFGPAVVAAILIFFMVKPFFARSTQPDSRVSLDPEREPVIFALIERICTTIGAPMPVSVHVDCNVNAGASLVGGPLRFFRQQLALTIGLPLAAGLTTQQLAGVLAHEFGHFAQGAGMRLTYAVRSINQWFWRVVHERDEWDVLLDTWSRRADVRIRIVFWVAQGAVLCTRRVLWALMMLGHLISCLMLREMEYDADSYGIKMIGSDAFSETISRLRALDIAAQWAYGDVRQSWLSGALPNDFAALVANKSADLPPPLIENVEPLHGASERRWLATHPSMAERLEAARRMARPGVFARRDPAPELFADFSGLCRAATLHHYECNMRLDVGRAQLIDTNQVMLDGRHAGAAIEALQRFFTGGMNVLRPVLVNSDARPQAVEPGLAWESLQAARLAMKDNASSSETLRKRFADLEDQQMRAKAARDLIEAGYDVEPGTLGSFEPTTAAADTAISRIAAEQHIAARQLYPYESHVTQRFTAALDILEGGGGAGSLALIDLANHASAMIRVLIVMNRAHGAAVGLWRRIVIFDHVIAHARTRRNPERLNAYVYDLENVLRKLVDQVRKEVSDTPYPFAKRGVEKSLSNYLRGPDVTTEDIAAVLRDARVHANLFFELYLRVVGEIVLIVEQVEASPLAAG